MIESHFKGWAKPGPVPPGASSPTDVPPGLPERLSGVPPDESLDALSGHFRIYQLRRGHRFSTDDLLTAWYGTTCVPSAAAVLDLGSGIGSVGMMAAWRLRGARFVAIEAQDESVRLARKSSAYNGLDGRYEIRHGDFRNPAALSDEERFDLVLASPPYFPLGTGIEGDHPQKVACRFELRGDIRDYARIASEHLATGGIIACVFPEEQRDRVEQAADAAGLAIIRRRPVVFREDEAPLVTLFAMVRSTDVPPEIRQTWVESPLVIRRADGSVHPEYIRVKLSIGFPP